jgi:hypothetical protein
MKTIAKPKSALEQGNVSRMVQIERWEKMRLENPIAIKNRED